MPEPREDVRPRRALAESADEWKTRLQKWNPLDFMPSGMLAKEKGKLQILLRFLVWATEWTVLGTTKIDVYWCMHARVRQEEISGL